MIFGLCNKAAALCHIHYTLRAAALCLTRARATHRPPDARCALLATQTKLYVSCRVLQSHIPMPYSLHRIVHSLARARAKHRPPDARGAPLATQTKIYALRPMF